MTVFGGFEYPNPPLRPYVVRAPLKPHFLWNGLL